MFTSIDQNIMILKEGAVLVADAHADFNRREFLSFLHAVNSGEIVASQLILLGDMFDFYAPQCDFAARFAKPYLKLIAQIAGKIPVFYIEGNHDFCLEKSEFELINSQDTDHDSIEDPSDLRARVINKSNENIFMHSYDLRGRFFTNFKNKQKIIYSKSSLINTQKNGIFIIPFHFQPMRLSTPFGDGVAIAHGDNHLPFFTQHVLLFLRQKWLLKSLNFIDRKLRYKISRRLFKYLLRKKLDYKIKNFSQIASAKMQKYVDKIVIEGHFHQGEIYEIDGRIYANLPSFALECRYFVVEYIDEKINFAQKSLKGH